MKKSGVKAIFMTLLFVLAMGVCREAFASDAFTKLGRGVANTFTGWVELPKNIYRTSSDENALAGCTLGLAKGAGMSVVRTGAGIFEIATFPFPVPQDYKPVLEPEYVF